MVPGETYTSSVIFVFLSDVVKDETHTKSTVELSFTLNLYWSGPFRYHLLPLPRAKHPRTSSRDHLRLGFSYFTVIVPSYTQACFPKVKHHTTGGRWKVVLIRYLLTDLYLRNNVHRTVSLLWTVGCLMTHIPLYLWGSLHCHVSGPTIYEPGRGDWWVFNVSQGNGTRDFTIVSLINVEKWDFCFVLFCLCTSLCLFSMTVSYSFFFFFSLYVNDRGRPSP